MDRYELCKPTTRWKGIDVKSSVVPPINSHGYSLDKFRRGTGWYIGQFKGQYNVKFNKNVRKKVSKSSQMRKTVLNELK